VIFDCVIRILQGGGQIYDAGTHAVENVVISISARLDFQT
jgi:hypothetical protein